MLEKELREGEEEEQEKKIEEGESEGVKGEEEDRQEKSTEREEEERWSQSSGQIIDLKDEGYEEDEKDEREDADSRCSTADSDEDVTGQEIGIYESIDTYGAVMWPAALSLCSFLDKNRQTLNLQGKTVLELGSGTGLVAIVAALLGASVTATDLPDVLGNLKANLMRNTRGRCLYTPQVAALCWGPDLEHTYPKSVYRYDYVLASDVVYHHDFLDELLVTMKHFCQPGTTLIWANKIRFETDLTFTENFKKAFHTSLLAEDREGEIKIFMATCKEM
uniref:Methyltransferase 21C, AARS1 lysine n=1 Tax=Myripristis murdjan TaxID=586833 RepID=A0A667YNT2_9TELE